MHPSGGSGGFWNRSHLAAVRLIWSIGVGMHSLLTLLPGHAEGTTIRRLQASDLERFHAYRSDAGLAKYQGWSPMSLEVASGFINEMESVSELRRGKWVQLGVVDSQSNALIGDLGLYLEHDESAAEVGFTVCRMAQGLGHATRAVRFSLSLVFQTTAAEHVRAVTDSRNISSIRVLERANFRRSATQQALFKGEPCTEFVYVCRRTDA